MQSLDNVIQIKKLDTNYCYDSIFLLPQQCESAWSDINEIDLPTLYSKSSAILFCGMGGSAYGGHIIKSLYKYDLNVPVDLVSDYHLPNFVNRDTLIVVSSYSGNTEETISCVQEALEKAFDTNIIGVTSGGTLAETLAGYLKPVYRFNPVHNPSLQPRLAQGYMQIGQIGILAKLGFLPTSQHEVEAVFHMLSHRNESLSVESPVENNLAKTIAYECKEKSVFLIGGEFLEGALHAIRNPFHETAKHFADFFLLPEANHHLMEGLSYPQTNKKDMIFYCIDSDLYSEPIKNRLYLTSEIIKKNEIEVKKVKLTSQTRLEQVFELIQLGNFVTFYLAVLHDVNPVKIPWVDYFKDALKEQRKERKDF